MTRLPVLGWKEEASLPEWGIKRLRVKLDTGAKTSAIHVSSMEVVGHHELDGHRLPVLDLVIPLSRIRPDRVARTRAKVVGYRSVRDTGANAERRPLVRTRLVCGPIDADIEVTVTDRTGMIFRMILGRQALSGHAVVDPEQGYTTARSAKRSVDDASSRRVR